MKFRPCGNSLCQNNLPHSILVAQTSDNKGVILKDFFFVVSAKCHIPVCTAKTNGVDFNSLFLYQFFNFFQNQTAAGGWFSIS